MACCNGRLPWSTSCHAAATASQNVAKCSLPASPLPHRGQAARSGTSSRGTCAAYWWPLECSVSSQHVEQNATASSLVTGRHQTWAMGDWWQ
eukprot:80493-Prorocentrum_lima.AAC.1